MSTQSFLPGEPVPWFTCRASNNLKFHFDAVAGRHLVLSFYGSMAREPGRAAFRHTTQELPDYFDDENIAFFAVSTDPADEESATKGKRGIRYFWDFDFAVSTLYGAIDTDALSAPYRSFTLVLDPSLRIIANIPMDDVTRHNEALEHVLSKLPPMAEYSVPAPVLVLPNVFEPEMCKALIRIYDEQGGEDSGFMRDQEGNTIGVLDHGFKRRSDCRFDLPEHEDLCALVRARVTERLVPEIKKAFQAKITRLERYVVACYDANSGGFFRPHRDNTTKGTAHRMFACTLNLNTEDYEGGDLRFPEYGRHSYRAPTGGAVVFSCSLLHEALPVTKGRRYAFLPFLYDDAAARLRAGNRKFLTGEWINQNAEPPAS